MAQPTSRARVIGDYIVGRQIGSGSFSVVWHARHRVHGLEVAIKEIGMDRLSKKLQESLLSEIVILKKINHPNIIHLYDIIQVPGRINLVLEYCRGGDLSRYIQRHERIPEETAKHFMQQLAAGLQILRQNNLIHRDLKPQNLLLSTNANNFVLKIADFGFARSLQPRGLAETLCGSPLYMAPEIMQLQKYDAKVTLGLFCLCPFPSLNRSAIHLKLDTQADLWSVGAILFQLVTGNTPFTGNNPIQQLLQNILKSNELCFPPNNKDMSSHCIDLCQKLLRRNPVERLTFEEFFNHPFLSQNQPQESFSSRMSLRATDGVRSTECSPMRHGEVSSQDDCLPFLLDDDSSGHDQIPSSPAKRDSMRSTYGFYLDKEVDKKAMASNTSANMGIASGSRYSSITHKVGSIGFKLEDNRSSDGKLKEPITALDQRPSKACSEVVDSLEFIEQEYVLVSGPPMEVSSASISASRPNNPPCKSESFPMGSVNKASAFSAPVPIVGAAVINTGGFGSLESRSSTPSGTSQGSMDMGDSLEQPSAHSLTRIKSLQRCASAIRALVNEKVKAGKQLEAFSIQLVILAVWKQALHICHTHAASALEGSPNQETTRVRRSTSRKPSYPDTRECLDTIDSQGPKAVCSQIEKEFLFEVGHAEELAKTLDPMDGSMEMPDAMETIYQSALALGRRGAVDELMGEMESAVSLYSKAVRLLIFLLVEAPSLILNPPFSLTNTDRIRLRTYIDILNNRQSQSRSQRVMTSSVRMNNAHLENN
ncbi:Protein kinase domain [Macleaya cordata]|uniref:Protein kinase domain n=1 Tax=Macleaya cordata TaxID=56857 RepID=A0A200R4Z3_MACCD|nr:Protein kinase domain [Macleaya cordata]